jgi:hypothetical protein
LPGRKDWSFPRAEFPRYFLAWPLYAFVLLSLCPPTAPAQSALPPDAVLSEVGPNSRTWTFNSPPSALAGVAALSAGGTTFKANASGTRGNRVVELGTGMNFWDPRSQQWQPSQAEFQIQDNAFVAERVQHRVQIQADLNVSNAVSIITPDGILLGSTPAAIGLFDTVSGNYQLIGNITNCAGVLTSSNQILFENAFSGGVCADIVYTLKQGSFEQDVVLTGHLDPTDYGFSPATTRIQIWTEMFVNSNPDVIQLPVRIERNPTVRQQLAFPDLIDQTIGFGNFVYGPGCAYVAGPNGQPCSSIAPVAKEFARAPDGSGRVFMIESVEFGTISNALNALPPCGAGVQTQARAKSRKTAAGYALLPAHPPKLQAGLARKPVASLFASANQNARPGLTIDYLATVGGSVNSSFTFQSDETYFVGSPAIFNGNVTMEGGVIVKFPTTTTNVPGNMPSIQINNTLTLATTSYRPAIFTAADDNTVGSTVSTSIWAGYTGVIQNASVSPNDGAFGAYYYNGAPYANPAIQINCPWSTLSLHDLRFSYAVLGICSAGYSTGTLTVAHSQFVNCIEALSLEAGSGITANVYNCLLSMVANPISQAGGYDYWSFVNCTIDDCRQMGYERYQYPERVAFTNSILSQVGFGGGTVYPVSANTAAYNSPEGGSFSLSSWSLSQKSAFRQWHYNN